MMKDSHENFSHHCGALSPDLMKAVFVQIKAYSNHHRSGGNPNTTINHDNRWFKQELMDEV